MARLFTHHALLAVVLLVGLGSLEPQNPKWEEFEMRNPKLEDIKLQAPTWEALPPIWWDSTKA